MSERDRVFDSSIPDIYNSYMVPLLFEPYAVDLAARIAEFSPETVLETAAGTGVVTRALAPLLGSSARYWVTDLNQPMLDCAAKLQGDDRRIVWRQADASKLPFDDGAFDIVCCQFGAMFFPDKIAGYAEARRVLKPSGRFVFNVWDHLDANEFSKVIADSVAAAFPDNPPQFIARTPHGYHDTDLIRAQLAEAGFSKVSIDTIEKQSHAPTARYVAIALCQGTPFRNEITTRDASRLEAVTDQAATAIAERFGQGAIAAKMQAHIVVAAS